MGKKLYRSTKDRVFLGVCGGLAEYLNSDPVLIRIVAILLLVLGFFPAVAAYLIMALIIPLEGSTAATTEESIHENIADMKNTTTNMGEEIRATFDSKRNSTIVPQKRTISNSWTVILGIIVIAIGVLILLGNIIGLFWRFFWPAIIIVIGLLIILMVIRRK